MKFKTTALLCMSSLPLLGGTGRPRDGFLSFIILLGFLGALLGLLYLTDLIKLSIRKFFDDR